MIKQARAMLDTYGVDIDPRRRIGDLSIALIQLVEIAKATTWGAKVLLLDEPTSAIPDREVERLYEVVHALKKQGVAMLYTTHRMAEIQELADRVVVLRDGRLVLQAPLADTTEDGIVRAMIGRDLDNLFPEITPAQDEVGLRVTGLRLQQQGPTVDLEVRRGRSWAWAASSAPAGPRSSRRSSASARRWPAPSR
ncbi:hypothetical protein GA0074692_1223 [Micromonospora pallida]|uniref:ABC transporter n=1 Tax=Micromonospora pallida TaxID=145854 RepID=A0A1C6RWQ1_9ACTN|nr:hypothetical protein [Micromonospora pallida]SCL21649.1 hypothetical protein GA0074692_1223 [Micromonospora pallida]